MSNLSIVRSLTPQLGNTSPDTVYLSREDPQILAKAWKMVVNAAIGGSPPVFDNFEFKGFSATGNVFFVDVVQTNNVFQGSVGNSGTVGYIYNKPEPIHEVGWINNAAGVGHLEGVTIFYSNDTTDGIDGTWTEALDIPTVGNAIAGAALSFSIQTSLKPVLNLDVSSSDGRDLFKGVSREDIVNYAMRKLATDGEIIEVSNLSIRDQLDLDVGSFVSVLDTSGDSNLSGEPALYAYDPDDDVYTIIQTSGTGLLLSTVEW